MYSRSSEWLSVRPWRRTGLEQAPKRRTQDDDANGGCRQGCDQDRRCRCILGARDPEAPGGVAVVPLSQDHKVNLPVEQARIESKGGYVRPERVDPDGEFVPARMYEVQGKPWIGPGLCISRALGDLNALRCGLIPTPEVYSHTVRDEDKFIILASDGVWYARDRCLLSPHSHPPILRRTRTS